MDFIPGNRRDIYVYPFWEPGIVFDCRAQLAQVDGIKIIDKKYDLSINRYKEVVYEEVKYDPPKVILQRIKELQSAMDKGIAELEAMLDPDSGFARPDPGRMVHGLKAQLAGEPALAGLVKPLLAMNDAFTRVLGMLERGGINPLQHAKVGFPLDVFDTAVRCSNGLMYLSFRLLARQGPPSDFIQSIDSALAGFVLTLFIQGRAFGGHHVIAIPLGFNLRINAAEGQVAH